jgi:hypothetical protein
MTNTEPVAGPLLTVVLNGQAVIEYDRRKPLASRQRLFLDRMDRDMDRGFSLDGRQETSPDLLTRARFVATSLAEALEAENDSVAAATCAYLALRLPDLKQVRADRKAGQMHIDLVFDAPPVQTQTVHFVRPGGDSGLH